MYAPDRGLTSTNPSAASVFSAARTTRSFTWNSFDSAETLGIRSPPRYLPTCSPLTMRSRSTSVTAVRPRGVISVSRDEEKSGSAAHVEYKIVA
jgi:hypothetical protein